MKREPSEIKSPKGGRVARGGRTTMRDVAERASVSIMTVSNVINGRAGAVSATTRRRVERAMKELDYHPNVTARALRSTKSNTLAFLLRDESDGYLADPLTSLITAGVGDVLREQDRSLLIRTVRTDGPPESLLAPVLEGRVDGAFVLLSGEPGLRRRYVEQLSETSTPFVVFDEVLEDQRILSVRAADRDAGRMLAERLLLQGHKRIAFIGARVPWAVVEQRHLGYADALHAAGIQPAPELQLFEAGWQPSGGALMTGALLELDEPPTAVMCGSDALALGAIQAVKGSGREVPKDVAVTGFDDFTFSAFVEPALTTVRIPAYQMGRLAAGMLLGEIAGDHPDARQLVLPVELVARSSA
jgi:LacI family transcriptional regulator